MLVEQKIYELVLRDSRTVPPTLQSIGVLVSKLGHYTKLGVLIHDDHFDGVQKKVVNKNQMNGYGSFSPFEISCCWTPFPDTNIGIDSF